MENLYHLIEQLERTVPLLNAEPLCLLPPESVEPEVVCQWLREHLEEQELVAYQEMTDILDSIPYIKTLEPLGLEESYDINFMIELSDYLDWSTSTAHLPFDLPFINYLNHLLAPHRLCLMVVPNAESWHILCVHDRPEDIKKLTDIFAHFHIPLVQYPPMDRYEVLDYIEDLAAA